MVDGRLHAVRLPVAFQKSGDYGSGTLPITPKARHLWE